MHVRLTLFLGLVGFFGFFAHGYIENTDAEVTMHAARALWLRGDPGLRVDGPDTWAAERLIAGRGLMGMRGRNGKHYVWFPVGHQLLMTPCVVLGELLARWFPAPERALFEIKQRERGDGEVWGRWFWTRFLVSWIPVLAVAGAAMMLWSIARSLGAAPRDALLAAGAGTLCTQFWPGGSETMSDNPGMFFLLAMAACVFGMVRAGTTSRRVMFLAGASGGWAVLVRYPHAAPVMVLAAVAAWRAWRAGRVQDVLWLAGGAVPEAAILLAANWLRFGSPWETGYSAGADPHYWNFPPWIGLLLILGAFGKGVMWFSPPLWLALGIAARHWRAWLRFPWGPTLAIFWIPVFVWAHAAGWAAGQCWGIRYLTAAVALLVVVAFALDPPWRSRPRRTALICALGLIVSAGGVITPYRGQQELAIRAGEVYYQDLVRRGELLVEQVPDRVNVAARFSPIHTHWIYAGLSVSGRLQRGGSVHTTEPLFGVRVPDPVRITNGEDVGFRHVWWRYLTRVGLPEAWSIVLALVWVAGTCALLARGIRAALRGAQDGDRPAPKDPENPMAWADPP